MLLRKKEQKCNTPILHSFPRINHDIFYSWTKPSDRWKEAVRTLGKLHRIDPTSVGLSTFGKPRGFYDRQIVTFRAISESQGKVKDVETREAVGAIPNMNEMLDFFSDHRMRPADRGTIIHGDYKIDNLVYHETEPRVIGILECVSLLPNASGS